LDIQDRDKRLLLNALVEFPEIIDEPYRTIFLGDDE
jgi:hypothetical protein